VAETKRIKQFGLQRSGTNYLRLLLLENYDVDIAVNSGGWKHGTYQDYKQGEQASDYLVVSKHPLSWMVSMHRYLNSFLHMRAPFRAHLKRGTMVQLWNFAHDHWLRMQDTSPGKWAFVRFESLVTEPESTCQKIARRLSLTPTGEFRNIERYVDRGRKKRRMFNRTFYVKKRYMKFYDAKLLAYIWDILDLRVMAALGYSTKRPKP